MTQPVPPSFKDLGKAANDLLGRDYPIFGTNLEVKTKAPNNVVFKVRVRRSIFTQSSAPVTSCIFTKPTILVTLRPILTPNFRCLSLMSALLAAWMSDRFH